MTAGAPSCGRASGYQMLMCMAKLLLGYGWLPQHVLLHSLGVTPPGWEKQDTTGHTVIVI